MQRMAEAVAKDEIETVTMSVGTQRRAVLEAVAFGTFLRDVETWCVLLMATFLLIHLQFEQRLNSLLLVSFVCPPQGADGLQSADPVADTQDQEAGSGR